MKIDIKRIEINFIFTISKKFFVSGETIIFWNLGDPHYSTNPPLYFSSELQRKYFKKFLKKKY